MNGLLLKGANKVAVASVATYVYAIVPLPYMNVVAINVPVGERELGRSSRKPRIKRLFELNPLHIVGWRKLMAA